MMKNKKKIKKTIFLSIIFFLALFFTFFRFGNNKAIAGEFEDWLKNRASGQGLTAIQTNGYWYAVPKDSVSIGSNIIPVPGTNYIKLKESDSDAIAPINLDDMKVKYTQETGKQPTAGSISNPMPTSAGGSGGAYQNQEKIPGAGQTSSFVEYLKQIIRFGFAVIGIMALFMISIGAYQYLMAAGNLAKVESAKETIGSALLGLVLGLTAFVILRTINPELVKIRELSNLGGTGGGGTASPNATRSIPSTIAERMSKYDDIVQKYAQQKNIDSNVIRAIIEQESNWKPDAEGKINKNGSQDFGMMQINNKAHPAFFQNNDWSNPDSNIAYGTNYLAGILNGQAGGDMRTALAMYNGGFTNPNYSYADQVLARVSKYNGAGSGLRIP